MIRSILNDIEETLLPREGWLRTCALTIGIGTGVLFCFKYLLATRRGVCRNQVLLTGKTCIVTGANTGIGKAVALELVRRKARVILACRDIQKGNAAAVEIRKELKHSADINVYRLDLASFESIRHFADVIKGDVESIDVLVNNAGVMSCPFKKSQDGIEMQFAVNHLGHFLLTGLLLDKMRNNEDARIIVVTSSLYKRVSLDLVNYNKMEDYSPFLAYARTKLANLLFCRELSKRLPEGITVNSMHPGVVWTELGRHQITNFIMKYLYSIIAYFILRTPEQGAQTIIHMATDQYLRGVSGKYFGDCRMEELKENAEDDKVAHKLWEISEELTGFEWK